jgi:hypothetical protein
MKIIPKVKNNVSNVDPMLISEEVSKNSENLADLRTKWNDMERYGTIWNDMER